MQYDVKLSADGRNHEVIGLAEKSGDEPNTMLIYYYPERDIDTKMKNVEMMHRALYDLFQCHESLKDGDTFKTEFGDFKCAGVHVEEA